MSEVGDWVRVWGQVVEEAAHPDDVVVELFSHSDQYRVHVRADRVTAAEIPSFADRCPHLHQTRPEDIIWRCERHHGHSGKHAANTGRLAWKSCGSAGYWEDA